MPSELGAHADEGQFAGLFAFVVDTVTGLVIGRENHVNKWVLALQHQGLQRHVKSVIVLLYELELKYLFGKIMNLWENGWIYMGRIKSSSKGLTVRHKKKMSQTDNKNVARIGYEYKLGFLSCAGIGSRDLSQSLCNVTTSCIVQCSHWVCNTSPAM